jgi:hypothetical protein
MDRRDEHEEVGGRDEAMCIMIVMPRCECCQYPQCAYGEALSAAFKRVCKKVWLKCEEMEGGILIDAPYIDSAAYKDRQTSLRMSSNNRNIRSYTSACSNSNHPQLCRA